MHSGKKRSLDVVRSYEKIPHKMARTDDKEVVHLLPIKDKTGIVPQSFERGETKRVAIPQKCIVAIPELMLSKTC